MCSPTRKGHAAWLNSSLTPSQLRRAYQLAAEGAYRLIYLSPERLLTPAFLSFAASVRISMESKIIREEAEKGSAIFIGRCADDVLSEFPDLLNVFIFAPKADRIRRVAASEGFTAEEAERQIKRIDKQRRAYYQFYTDRKWGMKNSCLFPFKVFSSLGASLRKSKFLFRHRDSSISVSAFVRRSKPSAVSAGEVISSRYPGIAFSATR